MAECMGDPPGAIPQFEAHRTQPEEGGQKEVLCETRCRRDR